MTDHDPNLFTIKWHVCRECRGIGQVTDMRGWWVCRTCLETIDREWTANRARLAIEKINGATVAHHANPKHRDRTACGMLVANEAELLALTTASTASVRCPTCLSELALHHSTAATT